MKLAKRTECLLLSDSCWVGRPHTESLFVLDSSKPHPPKSIVKFKVLLCRLVACPGFASLVYFKVAINRLLSDNLVLAQEPSFCSISTRASQDSRTSPLILSEKNSSSGKTLIKNREVRQLYWFLAFCFIMVPQLRWCCVLWYWEFVLTLDFPFHWWALSKSGNLEERREGVVRYIRRIFCWYFDIIYLKRKYFFCEREQECVFWEGCQYIRRDFCWYLYFIYKKQKIEIFFLWERVFWEGLQYIRRDRDKGAFWDSRSP